MNTRMRTAVQAMKATPRHDKVFSANLPLELKETEKEKKSAKEAEGSRLNDSRKGQLRRERKIALQQDVDKLRKKLMREENVHRALTRAFTRPLGALPRLPPYLPSYTLELLAEVAVLEEEVVRLEEQVVSFRQGRYLEAVYISSSNKVMDTQDSCRDQLSSQNTKNMVQHNSNAAAIRNTASSMGGGSLDREQHLPSNRIANGNLLSKKHLSSSAEDHGGKENHAKPSPVKKATSLNLLDSQPKCEAVGKQREAVRIQRASTGKEASEPNKLSEEILRCLLSILTRISLPKNGMVLDCEMSPSVSGSSDSLEVEGYLDPYGICSEFGRRDIGPYKHLHELEACSIDPNLLVNSPFLTQRLKLLLKKLASVDISELTHQQKLAFWINIYNSCMMNAFLENGIPKTPQMVVEQMPKAMVNVGGHLLSAMTIEHFILRLPYYSKHALKGDENTTRTMFRIDWAEPLVTFALACGSWSSPTVRVYTESQVHRQLEEAKRDYLQAAIGILKPSRLAIPKLLDWYLLDFAKDTESLMDWICMQLPSNLRNDAVECLEMCRSCIFTQPIQVIPYEFRFRYLFVP